MCISIITDGREYNPNVNNGTNADSQNSRRVILEEDFNRSDSREDLIPKKVALVMDIMGTGIKSDDTFTVLCYPAGTFKMIDDLLVSSRLRLNTEFVVFHLGTNLVMDFERSDTIGKVIRLSKTVRQKYPGIKIYFSTLVPRPPDHEITARPVIAFNDAVKTGTIVANRRYSPIAHISNHQLFVNIDTSYKKELFHKKELRFSRKGMRVFKDNLRHVLRL